MTPLSSGKKIQLVRHGEFIPCKTAFIDTHTPGSDKKENFTIIGSGVSESSEQHVHIVETPGFNIGAAGQPPQCRNSLHSHHTAEVFIVLKGRWRFFWGRNGLAGEVVLEEGDIFNIPTGIFRGFENIGQSYGMLMAILGGDDSGGGVVWAPQVVEEARKHGLILAETGKLYDTQKGESLPEGIAPMSPLSNHELAQFGEPSAAQVVPYYVARYWDMVALSNPFPSKVIGVNGMLKDKPGFEVDFFTHFTQVKQYNNLHSEVFITTEGHWRVTCGNENQILSPGDVALVSPHSQYQVEPSVSGEASLFRVKGTNDPAGPTWGYNSN